MKIKRYAAVNSKRLRMLNRTFLSAAATGALVELSNVGSGLVDSAMTARMLGPTAMAAIGIGRPMFSIMALLGGLLALGMQSVCTAEIGRGDYRGFGETSSLAFIAGSLASLLLGFVCLLFSGTLAAVFGARGTASELLVPAKQYIIGICIGMPAFVSFDILSPAVCLDNGEGLVRAAAVVGTVANAMLDYAAVRLDMGVFGMGLATSLSLYIKLAVLATHFRKKERMLHIRLRFTEPLRTLKQMCMGGMTSAVRRIANILRPILMNNYIVILGGTAAVTALSVKNSIAEFALAGCCGITYAIPLMMGIAYGEKNYADILHIGRLGHIATLAYSAVLAIFSVAFGGAIADFYVGTMPQIRGMVVFSMCLLGAEALSETLISGRISYLNAIGTTRDSWILQLCQRLLAIVPSVLVMGYFFKTYGVLSSTVVGYVVLLVAIYIANAIRVKRVKVGVRGFLRLDESFDVAPGDIIELDIRDMEDATLVSEQVYLFIKGHKLGARKAYHSALAVEESARRIFEQNALSKETCMDIRVVIKDGDLIIRIRDNGSSAYPFGGLDKEDEQIDPTSNIGIRLLRKTAKEIRHHRSLKVNYTLITV